MINKKIIRLSIGILLVLTLFVGVSAFSYDEDENGNPFYEADALIKVPSISIRDLFILQPSSEPSNPELGMIYLDTNSKRLKFYDGTGWYSIALEKVSLVSKQQVKETIEKKGEVKTCSASTDCGEWGDCINNYQSMICVIIDENCNKYEDAETRDCIAESPFELPSSASGRGSSSSNSGALETTTETGVVTEQTTEETPAEITTETSTESTSEITTSEIPAEEIPTETPTESESEQAPAPEPTPTEEAIPEELFDITFDLEENSLSSSDRLVVWITLQNFGKRYVPARLIYTITDERGKEVYRTFEEVRVYTDESLIKTFSDLTLEQGEYNLMLEVEYAGIAEDFELGFSVKTGIWAGIKIFFQGLF